ncbi:MAG: cytochrome P450 [Candidatus Binataceae bacterium]
MAIEQRRIPPGPHDEYRTTEDLLEWMSHQFERFGDIYKASVYGTSAYVTRDPQHAVYVLRGNWRNYKKGLLLKRIALLLGNGLMASEGELWKTQRRMIQPAFHHSALTALTKVITTSNVALLRKWEEAARKRASVNVTRDVSSMVLEIVLISIFGADYEQAAQYFNIIHEDSVRDLIFAQSFASLAKIVLDVVAQRRKKKKNSTDILGMLMAARDQNSGRTMTDRQLVNEIKTLIVAGHETTASTLNWIWYLLSQHPIAEEKLSSELNNLAGGAVPGFNGRPQLAFTRQVIEEVMRLYPAGWLLTRRALRADQIGDYFVPAGTEIYLPLYFIQRNPKLWKEPDRFNPDRFGADQSNDHHPLAMLPFSAGPRNCIGESLARVEMEIHLSIIARNLRLRYVQARPLELEAGVNLRSKYDFTMHPELTNRPPSVLI